MNQNSHHLHAMQPLPLTLPVASSILAPVAKSEETSIDLMYPLAITAYDEAQKRLDIVEKRLQDLLAFALTVTLGVITLTASKNANFMSGFFLMASACFLSGILIGLGARITVNITLVNLTEYYREYSNKPSSKFKQEFVCIAGKFKEKNRLAINKMGFLTNVAAICFLAEAIFLVGWACQAEIYRRSQSVQSLQHPLQSPAPTQAPPFAPQAKPH